MSNVVGYVGLAMLLVGAILAYKKYAASYLLIFAGFIVIVFWFSNRNDMYCPISIDDNRDCIKV